MASYRSVYTALDPKVGRTFCLEIAPYKPPALRRALRRWAKRHSVGIKVKLSNAHLTTRQIMIAVTPR